MGFHEQECIPVGCVPFATVAICHLARVCAWAWVPVGVSMGVCVWPKRGVHRGVSGLGVCPGSVSGQGVSGGVCVWPGGCAGGCLAKGVSALRGVHLSAWRDRHLRKHNLAAITVADGKNQNH